MKFLSQFKDFHKGQTCAILGGGVSLPKDLRSIPQVDVLIGVNQHAVILPLDYIVFSDREMWKYIDQLRPETSNYDNEGNSQNTPIESPQQTNDLIA